MTRRYGKIELGSKTLTAKFRGLLQQLPASALGELRAGLQRDVATVRAQVLAGEIDHAIDREAFARYACALRVLQAVVTLGENAPGLGAIAREITNAEEYYMPGGPPMSPVHDSMFVSWSMFDLGFGRQGETVAAIALGAASLLGLGADVSATLRSQAETRLGVYRIHASVQSRAGQPLAYRADELVTRQSITLQLVEELDIRTNDLVLVRATLLSDDDARARGATHIVFPTPYVLGGTDPEWIDYLERAAGDLRVRLDPDAYVRVMRGVGDPRRWLEYVVDGYVGQREHNVVLVEGMPDRPETLVHHLQHRPEDRFAIPPGAPPRERALILAKRLRERLDAQSAMVTNAQHPALRQQLDALTVAGGSRDAWSAPLHAVLAYEVGVGGRPPASASITGDPTLGADEIEYLAAVTGGFTSIFEVVAVRSGERMTLRDLVGRTDYEVVDRAATTELPARLVLWARIFEYRGTWLLDALHPQPLTPGLRDEALAQVGSLLAAHRRRTDIADGTNLFAAMVAWQSSVTKMHAEATARPLTTTTGEPIALSRTLYGFAAGDRPRVLSAVARLRNCAPVVDDASPSAPQQPGTTSFVITSTRGDVEAFVEVDATTLTIAANSVERLARVRQRITGKLAGVLIAGGTEVLDLEELQRSAPPRVQEPPTPEMREILAAHLRTHYATFLDQSVPALQGATPRDAAARPELRAALDKLLRDHEFHVTKQYGAGVIDFTLMRRELGLAP